MAKTVLNHEEQRIQLALLNGQYDTAQKVLAEAGNSIRPVYRAIFAASIAFAAGNDQRVWEAITYGLCQDGHNYELYTLLGDYYASRNLEQAYLCYENALFYCDNEEDYEQIHLVLDHFKAQGVNIPKAAIVILSYNLLDMTRDCIESIRETTPASAREIIVIDNASVDGSVNWLKDQKDIKLLCNVENKGFPAGCNQGISLAEEDSDIFLLNNDTVMTDNALFWLRMGLYENEEVGSTGSVSNYVSNLQEVIENGKSKEEYLDFAKKINIPMAMPYLNKVHLVGFALLIKRSVLKQIGLLDERFSPGNWEDNDICLRINLAGYRNVLCKNSFIIHWGSKSFRKEDHKYGNILEVNQWKFFEKWSAIGLDPTSYLVVRVVFLSILEQQRNISDDAIMVAGTGCGALLSFMQDKFPNAHIYGMEQDLYKAQIADKIADTVCVNFDEWKGDDLAETFDVIVINDVLEHTKNPAAVLKEFAKMLKSDGCLIFSFANGNHFLKQLKLDIDANPPTINRMRAREMLCSAKLSVNDWIYTTVDVQMSGLEEQISELQKQNSDEEDFLAYQWIAITEKQRMDIQFGNRLAVCIPTCERPMVVKEVLYYSAETYHRYGMDIYFYDSSRNDETKKIIESYQKKGYDNLYYIPVDPELYVGKKLEHVLMMDGIQKEYSYMWYCKDRVWCGEKTLKLMERAMEENPDIIFLDIGNPDCLEEVTVCRDVNQFYHRCGDFATSIDTTIYNIKTILKSNFNLDEFHERHGVYSDSFFHFLVMFEQLAKCKSPKICLLAGRNVYIFNSPQYKEIQRIQSIDTWVKRWIQTNEALPDCYKNKEDVIKRTASLPWLMGNIDALIEWHNRGVLTQEYYEEIKDDWERVSNIPIETLREIACGEYTK